MSQMSQAEWEKSITWVGVVAGCVITKDGKYLLVQEKQPSAYGLWNLPAGHVDKGETIEQAAVREAKEETGFDVAIIKKLIISHNDAETPVKHAFRAQITGGELSVQQDELLDVRWMTFQEIAKLNKAGKLREAWVWESISAVENAEN
jgi:ADP-ribose pyrophosphatase YjhB (NUDIX family)